ncbi:MAG: 30S ribosomal protein S16, partial [Patescibacteria group bacterium]|nr:30S ribosomal protein S16 [Patescibacteria group bacterium]
MLSIRLSRVGKKKQPSYRIIVLDKRKDPWGDYLENLGFYNPRVKPKEIKLKEERIKYWLSVGAQPSATVHNLLVDAKIIEGKKMKATIIKKK